MSLSSQEINLLVQHYLQELGYSHSSFTFSCESKIPSLPISKREVPAGSLVYLLEKGILYTQMEASADESLDNPEQLFAQKLNSLRNALNQSIEMTQDINLASRHIKVLPQDNQTEKNRFYLTDKVSLILSGHNGPVTSIDWSILGRFLATSSTDGQVNVWSFQYSSDNVCSVQESPLILHPVESFAGQPQDITCVAWSIESDPSFGVGTYAGQAITYKDGKEFSRIVEHKSPLVHISFSTGKCKLLSVSAQGKVIISDGAAIEASWELQGATDALWASDSQVIVSSGQMLYLLTIGSQEASRIYEAKDIITQIIFEKNHSSLAVSDLSGNVAYFRQIASAPSVEHIHHSGISSIGIHPKSSFYVAGNLKGESIAYDLASKDQSVLDTSGMPVIAIEFDPTGRYFASASSSNELKLFSSETKAYLFALTSLVGISCVKWSPTGRFLAIGLMNGDVSVVDFDQIC